jgi:glycosyltransferase involved in cell wall biosynthesis
LRIALDLRIYGERGIGRYNQALWRGLSDRHDSVTLAPFGSASAPMAPGHRRLVAPGYVAQEQFELPVRFACRDFDLVHFTANTAPMVRWRRPASVVTVHDVMYLRSPRELALSPSWRQTLGRAYRFLAFHSGSRRCDHIIAVSSYTARELERKFGRNLPPVTVVHSGVDPAFAAQTTPKQIGEALRPFHLHRGSYFLHPGAVDPRKNTSVVLGAFERYRASGGSADLVVVGLSPGAAAAFGKQFGSRVGGMHLLPFVPNDTMVSLVKGARAVVFVPAEEGFGYPLVEAMAAGTPAIVSSIEVLRELSAGAASEVPRGAVEPLAVLLRSMDFENPAVEGLRRRGLERSREFTIARMADRTIEAYQETLARHHAAPDV